MILPELSGYGKIFNVQAGNKDKNNKLMSFCIDDKKLLQKYKAIWTTIEDLNIDLNALTVYNDRHIKAKIGTCVDHVCNVSEHDIECGSFNFYWFFTCLPKQKLLASIFK